MILVVNNLISFHGFVFMAKVAKQLAPAERSAAVCRGPYNLMTKPTDLACRMADGTCIVLYCIEIFYMKQVS